MNAPLEATRFGSGQTVRRIEDPALVTGAGRYTDDETLPGQTYLVFLRRPYAHAEIAGIDASDAYAFDYIETAIGRYYEARFASAVSAVA